MTARFDRIARVQGRIREKGRIAIVVMNHDDYRYLFGTDRTQPVRLTTQPAPRPAD